MFEKLAKLEEDYRKKTTQKPHFDDIACYQADGVYQRQFFALDKEKSDQKVSTVIVLIGVNYTQNDTAEKSVEVDDSQTRQARKRLQSELIELSELAPGEAFHVIYTNLSPWITQKRWRELTDAKGRQKFLNQATELGYIDQLDDLLKKFDKVIWIGHTKDIQEELGNFFKRDKFKNKSWKFARNISYRHKKLKTIITTVPPASTQND